MRPRGEASTAAELLKHFEVPLRRPAWVLVPFVLLTTVALVAAFSLPRKYKTSTLILVESQKVPESFVRPGQEGPERPRLLTIRQEILSRTRLEQILEEVNPYPEIYGRAPLTEVIEAMRGAVSINVKGEDAFSIEYAHRDPHVAQEVTNRLAGLFIEETTRAREEQVSGAADFIEIQLEEARLELEQKEQDVRQFKEANMGRLPEQTAANLATLQRLQLEQQSISASLQSARQRMVLMERGLATPGLPADSSSPSPLNPAAQLVALRAELEVMEQRYTEEHPDLRTLRARVERLEQRIARANAADGSAPPSLASMRLEEAQIEVRDLEAKLADVDRRIGNFQRRVEESPRAEQRLATLTRDYQKLNENYLTLLNKKLDAQMAERLEKRWKGEHFRVLDPAYLPEEPYFPNRRLFAAIGMILGLGLGLALAFVAEFLDSSVKTLGDMEVFSPLPVLALIPSAGGQRSLLSRFSSGLKGRSQAPGLSVPADEDSPGVFAKTKKKKSSGGALAFVETLRVAPRPGTGAPEALLAPGGPLAEEFRSLASRVRALDSEKPLRCLAVASAVVGEGKSTVAIGLAAALAQSAGRVLLVEADLRRAVLDGYLGLPQAAGLSDFLRSGAQPIAVRRVVPPGFYLLSAGSALQHYEDAAFIEPEEVDRMKLLLETARSSYDFVIVDCPPLLPVADASVLQEYVDGFLIVVRERYAPIDTVLRSLDRVESSRLRGVVLNDHREVLPRYRKYQSEYYRKRA